MYGIADVEIEPPIVNSSEFLEEHRAPFSSIVRRECTEESRWTIDAQVQENLRGYSLSNVDRERFLELRCNSHLN
jgi:hypothetical protein